MLCAGNSVHVLTAHICADTLVTSVTSVISPFRFPPSLMQMPETPSFCPRPCAQDPAIYTAHALLLRRSPVDISEAQTRAVLRDMLDNATYGWLKMEKLITPAQDHAWLEKARADMQMIQGDKDVGQYKQFMAENAADYHDFVFQFRGRVDTAYITHGLDAFQAAYRCLCSGHAGQLFLVAVAPRHRAQAIVKHENIHFMFAILDEHVMRRPSHEHLIHDCSPLMHADATIGKKKAELNSEASKKAMAAFAKARAHVSKKEVMAARLPA